MYNKTIEAKKEIIKNCCKSFDLGNLINVVPVKSNIYISLIIFDTDKKAGYKYWYDANKNS